jgi:hypothetical protein
MKSLFLRCDCNEAASKLVGQFAASSHIDQTIDADTTVFTPTGEIIAVFLTQRIESSLYKPAYRSWKKVHDSPSNRATAMGTRSMARIRTDGTLSEQRRVPKRVLEIAQERQGVLGYVKGHRTPLTERHPDWLSRNKRLIKRVDRRYEKYMSDVHAYQQAAIEKTPHCRLFDTVFTTIYLARNFRTAYHRDSGNLRGALTALLPMGSFSGGELVFPRWRIAVALKPGDLLLFDPQQIHGNLPFEGKRLSAAFYCGGWIGKSDRN